MVICKSALFNCERFWYGIGKKKLSCGNRCLNTLSNPIIINYSNDDLVVERIGSSVTAIINRPASLNAINNPMVVMLQKLYREWEEDPDIGFVILKGRGRAFSAGGDLRSLYNLMKQGKLEECKQFFRNAYGFLHQIATYSKPHIFATPETLVGFHPDGGASFYLSRLPRHLGEYLALVGDTLNGAEMISCGLATHYTHTAKLPLVEKALGNLITSDPSVVGTCLQSFQDSSVHPNQTTLLRRIETVDRCFSHDTVEEIIQSLEDEAARKNDDWCKSLLKKLEQIAPLSLKVALESIRRGRSESLEQCLVREYRMSVQALHQQISPDFYEGIRARLVDKDYSPKWDPPSLEQVSPDMVDQYFSPLSPFEPQLELPKCKNMLS